MELSKSFETVVGTDLERPEMTDWKGKADFVLADAASCFRTGMFDIVCFNPPYLPDTVGVDRTIEGGRDLEVPIGFLRGALRVLVDVGKVVFLLSDHANLESFRRVCAERGFRMKRTRSNRVFFEELSVFEASRSPA